MLLHGNFNSLYTIASLTRLCMYIHCLSIIILLRDMLKNGNDNTYSVCSLQIPRERVIDTVELFHLSKQRYVSLKFLAWHFLSQYNVFIIYYMCGIYILFCTICLYSQVYGGLLCSCQQFFLFLCRMQSSQAHFILLLYCISRYQWERHTFDQSPYVTLCVRK